MSLMVEKLAYLKKLRRLTTEQAAQLRDNRAAKAPNISRFIRRPPLKIPRCAPDLLRSGRG